MSSGPLERIKEFIDFKGISISAFEKSCGFSNGSFASQLKNKKSIGVDKLENILKVYPELDANWILLGTGKMSVNDQALLEPNQPYQKELDLLKAKDETIQALKGMITILENENTHLRHDQSYLKLIIEKLNINEKQHK